MGNCQGTAAAAAVIEHPEGKIQRLYRPTPAEEVMKCNPGHHVALVVSTTHCIVQENQDGGSTGGGLRRTHVRLLKPKHTLLIGQVYRLIAEQEAIKALKERKHEMLKGRRSEFIKQQQETKDTGGTDQSEEIAEARYQEINQEMQRQRGTAGSVARARQWQPALCSIAEDGIRAE